MSRLPGVDEVVTNTRASRARAAEAREQILTAMREMAEPARFDQIIGYVLGRKNWTWPEEDLYATAMHRLLVRRQVVVFLSGWATVYRLATPDDQAADEDAAEVARMMSRWEPAP